MSLAVTLLFLIALIGGCIVLIGWIIAAKKPSAYLSELFTGLKKPKWRVVLFNSWFVILRLILTVSIMFLGSLTAAIIYLCIALLSLAITILKLVSSWIDYFTLLMFDLTILILAIIIVIEESVQNSESLQTIIGMTFISIYAIV